MPRARALTLIIGALVLALLVAACAGTPGPSVTGQATGAPTAGPGQTGASDAPPVTDEPAASSPGDEPTEPPAPTDEPAATDEPTTDPSPDATGSPDAGAGAACSGSDANRAFYVSVAQAVDWPVLCAVLPKGWFVATGSYRLAGGGRLAISYTGPNGASIALSEGAFCTDATGCVPAGTDGGAATLGPMDATLVRLDDGGLAVVASRGLAPSWLLVAHGIDEATTLAVAAALAEVAG